MLPRPLALMLSTQKREPVRDINGISLEEPHSISDQIFLQQVKQHVDTPKGLSKLKKFVFDDKLRLGDNPNQNFGHIPPILFSFKELESLSISHHLVSHIPLEILRLENLNELFIQCENLKSMASEILNIPALSIFSTKKSLIKSLTLNITTNESNLETLIIAENPFLVEIAINMIKLPGSKSNSTKNKNASVFSKLEKLTLSANSLNHLPTGIREMTNLKYIDCSQNKLEDVEDFFSKCKLLETVDLKDNKLKHLPRSITTLKNLKELNLTNNPLHPYCEMGDGSTSLGWIDLYRHFGDKLVVSKSYNRFASAELIFKEENKMIYWNFKLINKISFSCYKHSRLDRNERACLIRYLKKYLDQEDHNLILKYNEMISKSTDTSYSRFMASYLTPLFDYFLENSCVFVESTCLDILEEHMMYLRESTKIHKESFSMILTAICENIFLSSLDRKQIELIGSSLYQKHNLKNLDQRSLDSIINHIYKSIFNYKNKCLKEIIVGENVIQDKEIPVREYYKGILGEYIGFDVISAVDPESVVEFKEFQDHTHLLEKFLEIFTPDKFMAGFMKELNNTTGNCDAVHKLLKSIYKEKQMKTMFENASSGEVKITKKGVTTLLQLFDLIMTPQAIKN